MDKNYLSNGLQNIELYIGGAPLLENRVCEGLLKFGMSHPSWRFSLRGADFHYTKKWLKEQAISGVLVLIDSTSVARTLNASGVPWVHLMPGKKVEHPCINVDDYRIGQMGADFFQEKGFLRCAFCGVGTVWSARRAAGFQDRLAAANRKFQFIDFPFELSRNWGLAASSEQQLRQWVKGLEQGTAIMAAHDALANRLVDQCLRIGLRIPQDIAILGVGNHDLLCKLSPVPISSIDANVPETAIIGATMLEALISGKQLPRNEEIVKPSIVIERRSTEILVYGDDLVARVVAFIRDHACEGIGVENILKFFPVSHRTLSRRFDKFVGHSPAAEIRQARLRQAQNMLSQSDMSLTEIAYACGYADLSHMDRLFRQQLGVGPGELNSFRRTSRK